MFFSLHGDQYIIITIMKNVDLLVAMAFSSYILHSLEGRFSVQ